MACAAAALTNGTKEEANNLLIHIFAGVSQNNERMGKRQKDLLSIVGFHMINQFICSRNEGLSRPWPWGLTPGGKSFMERRKKQ